MSISRMINAIEDDDDVRHNFTLTYRFFLYEYNRVIKFEGQLINWYVKKMFPERILRINNDKVFTVIYIDEQNKITATVLTHTHHIEVQKKIQSR